MTKLTERDRALLEVSHNRFKKDVDLQNAIKKYAKEHGLNLPDTIRYTPGIDYVELRVNDVPVLSVNLPPVSNYTIRETEHTDRYLRYPSTIAV